MSVQPEISPQQPTPDRTDLRAQKARMRKDILARRAALSPAAQARAAGSLAARAEAFGTTAGRIVAGYHPIRGEIDPRPLLARLEADGAELALPAMVDTAEGLAFRRYRTGDRLEPGRFSTLEPADDAATIHPEIVLVPLVAFDRRGGRLGYGKGCYDRALAALERTAPVVAIGLAHVLQEVDAVPAEDHDRRLDAILTDEALIAVTREVIA